ncbi:hypothetical protein L1987_46374 [Smallanthus sonchifolius]|uniref:Uncharacterized protein n=1 Tax=Smallanthus sonchifolius TaxID=185202 RepID=A0ACB9FZI1_9ASTR|nr:hypothetical protein L1987_46374 [Smallanthus sonchifolius]
MSEEIPRSALGDVTNQVGKREFSLISTSGIKPGDECIHFAKKECRRVDSSKKENIDSVSKIAGEIKEPCPPDVRENAKSTSSSAVKAGDVVGECCQPPQLVYAIPSDVIVEDETTDSAIIPQIESKGVAEDNLGMDDGNDVSLDNFDSSKDENLDCSRFPESQESKCGLESCIGQKGDRFSRACMDMIKACPCSFCVKDYVVLLHNSAACLWSDLHYQDIKGRIAAIKKSQKEAAILVNRNSRDVATNFEKFSNMESDLTGRWKLLFLHMEDIFVREGTQLAAVFIGKKIEVGAFSVVFELTKKGRGGSAIALLSLP